MADVFFICFSISCTILVITTIVVFICRKQKGHQNTGQVIHYGAPRNAPPQYNTSSLPAGTTYVTSHTGYQQSYYPQGTTSTVSYAPGISYPAQVCIATSATNMSSQPPNPPAYNSTHPPTSSTAVAMSPDGTNKY